MIGDGITSTIVEERISATRLRRRVGHVLARVHHRGDSFIIERHGVAVARLIPVEPPKAITVGDFVRMWTSRPRDPEFADALERVNAADTPAENPWK